MSVVAACLTAASLPIIIGMLLRYLPDAILTLLAGIIALFSRDATRVRRAMTLLRVLRGTPPQSRDPSPPTQQ
ncbi:hypothetical protein Ga0074812_14812 [Parafrankia irregularis]|uniref:Uncharacterized protein n=1 Tax=Parafrankia irregularis TaxID=795642 RepID=A0A0S4R0U1_9ACTN|nr:MULTISPECIES: hypothetical protein [Parafrankia]MBE3206790.1 hypothetical protein [Parafrankia sp. CH37]CUU60812.1 hypothetical protein Ga0074812_14812 [Parafrankia irregularis]